MSQRIEVMSCIDEKVLYELLDNTLEGKERERVEEHLKSCEACKNKADELKAFDKGLKQFWKDHKKNCPSPEEMYEYSLGKLSKEEEEKILKHLQFCHVCRMKNEESEKIAEEVERLARAEGKEELPGALPSEIKNGVLQKLADALSLAEASKILKESLEKFWISHFSYGRPIKIGAIAPCVVEAYVADVGKGFEKEVIQEENSPFRVEINQFGKELEIILHTEAALFKNSIVRFILFEKEEEKYSGILFVSNGSGKLVTDLREKALKRPEKEPYKIKIDVMNTADILAELREPSSSKILMELMKSGNPEIIKLVTDIIDKRDKR